MPVYSVSLRSGSSGNSAFIRTESAGLALDLGMTGRQYALALESLGESADGVDGILLTHEHIDHSSGIGVVMRRHKTPLYATLGTYRALLPFLGKIDESLVRIIEPGQSFSIRETVITPFSIPHDAADPVGFRIHTKAGDIGVATDLGHFSQTVREALTGCRIVHLEANFDPDMLETGSYPPSLKKRIAGSDGHLSNQESGMAASWLIRNGTESLFLSHLSEENNLPPLALRTVCSYLDQTGARAGEDYVIQVAPRYSCSRPMLCQDPFSEYVPGEGFPGQQLTLSLIGDL